ncbi:MAG TPA: hypothetical protein VHX44_16410 [Planctomycetota bacterium]|nr:hypothetical protein [Planctomycetota bacterium]
MQSRALGVMMAVAFVLGAVASSGEASAADGRPGKGPAALSDALAVLKVNDPRLLDRELTQFAAGLGINPEPLRAGMAGLLFRSRNLEGIDLSRPALMAWRAKEPSLVAVIPLTDRRRFLDSFGAGFGSDAPLIRVGERDGTVVYTQNGNNGLLEYRLLVSDRAAYLASTTALCRDLAEYPLQPGASEAPLVFTASEGFLDQLGASAELSPDYRKAVAALSPGVISLQTTMRAGWNAFVDQLTSAELTVRPDAQGTMNFRLNVQAKTDSALAVWIGNQRNQPSRLLPLVRSEQSVFTVAGNVVWQGQAERMGKVFTPALKEAFAERWTAMVEENWTALWALADRAGPFAAASDLDVKDGKPVGESRYLGDQAKAQELMSLITLVSQNLTGTVGEAVTAGNATGYREQHPDGDHVLVSTERFLVSAQSTVRPALEAATEVVTRSQNIGALEGVAGIFQLSANFMPFVRTLVVVMGGDLPMALPIARCTMTVKTGLMGQLVADGTFPAPVVAQLLRDSGLIQMNDTAPKK